MFSFFRKAKPAAPAAPVQPPPDYAPLPEPSKDRPTCQACFFWRQRRYVDPDQFPSIRDYVQEQNIRGVCKRNPTELEKYYFDWCGEFR